jgi:hypothetical protein
MQHGKFPAHAGDCGKTSWALRAAEAKYLEYPYGQGILSFTCLKCLSLAALEMLAVLDELLQEHAP